MSSVVQMCLSLPLARTEAAGSHCGRDQYSTVQALEQEGRSLSPAVESKPQ